MEQRNAFLFYRSFYDAALFLRPKERVEVILAICEYALDGKEPELKGMAAAVFLMAKPNLDANRRRFENGKKGRKSKTKNKPNAEADVDVDIEKDIEKDIRKNTEVEMEVEVNTDPPGYPPAAATAAERTYLSRIDAWPSASCWREFRQFEAAMGEECCLRAIDEALDAQKPTWPYIRAILREKQARGVRSLADWEALEARHTAPGGRGSWQEIAEELP